MSLIEQILQALESGDLTQPLTTEQIKLWVAAHNIKKSDGAAYADNTLESILSNSDEANSESTLNQKPLFSRINAEGKKEYWLR
ncbi:hypothetical protein [uncultured Thiodictyon sp.]|uniref:hypothetical protein n=1 Tax=uncultured Thiodictyon sp. TaxID=1846217 RepID=UPI0025EE9727|nr:hypothetical protein [uncultured Thiodictyon sp.]